VTDPCVHITAGMTEFDRLLAEQAKLTRQVWSPATSRRTRVGELVTQVVTSSRRSVRKHAGASLN